MKTRWEHYKFLAALQGVDLDKQVNKAPKNKKDLQDNVIFGDPEDYKKMSEEERNKLTNQLMVKFKDWAGTGTAMQGADQTGVKDA